MSKETNPYSDDRGIPLPGQEQAFFDWARQQEVKRRDDLSEEDRKKVEQSEQALRDRMDS